MSKEKKTIKIDREFIFQLAALACKDNFRKFVEYSWGALNPHPLSRNMAFDAICEHLQAVSDGQIQRLVINVPPKFLKSMLCSVFFPAWEWTQRPWLQYLCISYTKSLPIRDNQYTRQLIYSPLYQAVWGHMFELTGKGKELLTTNRKGHKGVTSSVSSLGTGTGGHRIIYDDPHSTLDAFRPATIEKAIIQWNQVISTRLQPGSIQGSVILIMQKVCKGDMTDHFLELGNFEHLVLPMEYDPSFKHPPTSLGFTDPREDEGELLDPVLFPREQVDRLKDQLGHFGAETQFQQKTVGMVGNVVDVSDFKRFEELPPREDWRLVFQAWDTAQKDDELVNSPWVGGTWVLTDTAYYLIDVSRSWNTYPDGKRVVLNYWQVPPYDTAKYGHVHPSQVVIENKSTGASLLQELPSLDARIRGCLFSFDPVGSKLQRLYEENALIRAGKIYIPESAPWLYSFLSEVGNFPMVKNKDQADMLSMSLKHIRRRHEALTSGWKWQNTEPVFI